MVFIDSHAHLEQSLFDTDLDAVIGRMREKNVKCLNVGINLKTNRKTLEISHRYDDVLWSAIGLHPDYAQTADLDKEIEFVREHSSEIVAIGEIGLDFYHFKKEDAEQKQGKVFEAQLELAVELKKPVFIHSRKAIAEVLEAAACFPQVKKVLHGFLLDDWLGKALETGCWVSVPTLKIKERVKIFKQVPLERVFLETDSPFLWRDGRNEPSNVIEAYQALADAKNAGLTEVEKKVEENFRLLIE